MTPHYKIADMIRSETAARKGIDNTPGEAEKKNLLLTASILEQVFWLVGDITSWYRSEELNKAIGGVEGSYHTLGLGVDFRAPVNITTMEVVYALKGSPWLPIRKVILYKNSRHIHMSICKPKILRTPVFLFKDENGYRRLP